MLYALCPFNQQEIAMPSVIFYIFKLLFISYKERSNKWLDDAVTFTFQRHRTERKRDVAWKKFLVFKSLVFKNN